MQLLCRANQKYKMCGIFYKKESEGIDGILYICML